MSEILSQDKHLDFFSIPIFIISYNRKHDLELLVKRLIKDGYHNINVIDNASKDKTLLEYLHQLEKQNIKVFYMKHNYGHRVLWDSHLFDDIICNQYYVLTDPDVIPIEECPTNYVEVFFDILQKYPNKTKVGFSLKIDDLPEDYIYKYKIIRLESFYWEKQLPYKFRIYDAPIDTTFALYRPMDYSFKAHFYDGIRTGEKYEARHLGWYVGSDAPQYYLNPENVSSSSLNKTAMEGAEIQVIKNILSEEDFQISFLRLIWSVGSIKIIKKILRPNLVVNDMYLLLKKLKSHVL